MCKIVKMKVITPFVGSQVDICKAFGFDIPDGCAPASSQSSSLHNSLRSINPATAGCSLQKPTVLLAYRSRGLETQIIVIASISFNFK